MSKENKKDTTGWKNEDFLQMCNWVERELMGYSGTQRLHKNACLRLQGLRKGQSMANNSHEMYVESPNRMIEDAVKKIASNNLMMFYPDAGSMKRYSSAVHLPYAFGIKNRDWESGEIKGLDLSGEIDQLPGKDILIVDDICSRGGTFYYSAKKLKEAGVGKIYLYITHCENTIYEGELLKNNGLIEKIYTTDTILTNLESPKIELVERFR